MFESECSFEIGTTVERFFSGTKLQREAAGALCAMIFWAVLCVSLENGF